MAASPSLPPSDEARAYHRAQLEAGRGDTAWTGWVVFAASVLVMIGLITVFQGFLALFDEGYFLASGEQLVLIGYDAWGLLLMAWGLVLLAVGSSLYAGRAWARWFAVLAVIANVVAQVGFLPAHPFLSITLIALGVIVLYALTAGWSDARQGL